MYIVHVTCVAMVIKYFLVFDIDHYICTKDTGIKKNYINVTDGNAINLYFTNQNTPSKSRDVLTTNMYVNLI